MARSLRVAVTGTGGRVGRALADRLAADHAVVELPRKGWDFAEADTIRRIEALDFDLLIHPAAMTSPDVCEAEPEVARRVNAEAPAALAEICRRRGAGMLHFSTDYVFDGKGEEPLDESAPVGPLSVYGRTKAEAEQAVLAAGGCVMRVSWVFGPERASFPDQVLRKALAGEPLAAVADKTSMPCYTRDLAEWVSELIAGGGPQNEILHACNSGPTASWHDMAEQVLDGLEKRGRLASRPVVEVQQLEDADFFHAPRPRKTAMANARLAERIGRQPRDWREAMAEFVGRLLADLSR